MVQFAGENRVINYDQPIPMLGGFQNGKYDFEPISVEGLEAGFYHINAGETTRVVKIVKEVRCGERLEQGKGWFLKMNSLGDTTYYRFDADRGSPQSVTYGLGDIIVWGAQTEARIATFSDRPFTDEMEVGIEIGSKQLPGEFWTEYNQLLKSSS